MEALCEFHSQHYKNENQKEQEGQAKNWKQHYKAQSKGETEP